MPLSKPIIAALDSLTIDSIDCSEYILYNYKTGENEIIADKFDDEKAMEYIPQDRAAIGLYQSYRQLGKSEWESVAAVLTHAIEIYQKINPALPKLDQAHDQQKENP